MTMAEKRKGFGSPGSANVSPDRASPRTKHPGKRFKMVEGDDQENQYPGVLQNIHPTDGTLSINQHTMKPNTLDGHDEDVEQQNPDLNLMINPDDGFSTVNMNIQDKKSQTENVMDQDKENQIPVALTRITPDGVSVGAKPKDKTVEKDHGHGKDNQDTNVLEIVSPDEEIGDTTLVDSRRASPPNSAAQRIQQLPPIPNNIKQRDPETDKLFGPYMRGSCPYSTLMIIKWKFVDGVSGANIAKRYPVYVECKAGRITQQGVDKRWRDPHKGVLKLLEEHPAAEQLFKVNLGTLTALRDKWGMPPKNSDTSSRAMSTLVSKKSVKAADTSHPSNVESTAVTVKTVARRGPKENGTRGAVPTTRKSSRRPVPSRARREMETAEDSSNDTDSDVQSSSEPSYPFPLEIVVDVDYGSPRKDLEQIKMKARNGGNLLVTVPKAALPDDFSYARTRMVRIEHTAGFFCFFVDAPTTSEKALKRYALTVAFGELPLSTNLGATVYNNKAQQPNFTEWTFQDMVELYVLALAFGNARVCDMVMDVWSHLCRQMDNKPGFLKIVDSGAETASIRILSTNGTMDVGDPQQFEINLDDIVYLVQNTRDHYPARRFWNDILFHDQRTAVVDTRDRGVFLWHDATPIIGSRPISGPLWTGPEEEFCKHYHLHTVIEEHCYKDVNHQNQLTPHQHNRLDPDLAVMILVQRAQEQDHARLTAMTRNGQLDADQVQYFLTGTGARLDVTREEAEQRIKDGWIPMCKNFNPDLPKRQVRLGFPLSMQAEDNLINAREKFDAEQTALVESRRAKTTNPQ